VINQRSLAAVGAARLPGGRVRPLYDSYGFARIPGTLLRLFGESGAEALPADVLPELESAPPRVVAVLADALGWAFVERFAERAPLLARLREQGVVSQLTSQFPSTTTAHVTTLCTGKPVGETGFYEWYQFHEAAGGLVGPLLYARPGETPGSLPADPAAFYDFGETFVQSLVRRGVPATSFQNGLYASSPFSQCALAGAEVVSFWEPGEALRLAAEVERGFAFVYLDAVDAACHAAGPGSEEATAATRASLDALERLVSQLQPGTLLAITADHGHVPADPARCMYLNTIWPELPGLLSIAAPAGSPRDVFLHVQAGRTDEVVGGLRERLGERAIVEPIEVLIADGLFGQVSDRLRHRLGDVAVLPAAGHEAYWYEPPVWEQHLFGHHGGLSAEESHTYLGLLPV
jgi:hypothetical protein